MAVESKTTARNYSSMPVMISEGEGSWVKDVDGKYYIDALAGYSANNFGHRHPELIEVAHQQLDKLTLTARAFMNDKLGPFTDAVSELTGKDLVLPANGGAEAVETALKTARKWGELVKGIPENQVEIITAKNNFHGRTISIVSFSQDEDAYKNFGPKTPGFVSVEYGDAAELEAAITENTAAVMIEPVQGEAGVIIPPAGYIQAVREICTRNNVKLILDEIQSGFGRTGTTFAAEHSDVEPDMYIMGKALSGGILPVSAVAANEDFLGILKPGEHGSTYGGNPMAAAVGAKAVELIMRGDFQRMANKYGELMHERLDDMMARDIGIVTFRRIGLWAGVDIDPSLKTGKEMCLDAIEEGLLMKDTHGSTVRISPPLNIGAMDLHVAMDRFEKALRKKR
jgi:ornithine--oxo-acid transaminase